MRVLTSDHQSSSRLLLASTVRAYRRECVQSNLRAVRPCASIPHRFLFDPIFLRGMNKHATNTFSNYFFITFKSRNNKTIENKQHMFLLTSNDARPWHILVSATTPTQRRLVEFYLWCRECSDSPWLDSDWGCCGDMMDSWSTRPSDATPVTFV